VQQRGGDFFLVSLPNANGLRPLAVSNLVTDMWYQGADLVSLRTQGERKVRLDQEESRAPRLWVQGGFARDRYGDRNATVEAFGSMIAASTRQQGERFGLQAGADLPVGPASVGVTAGYQHGNSKFGGIEVAKASGFNVGAYATAGAMVGAHASLLAKYDRNNVEMDETVFAGLDGAPDSSSIGLDGHVGYGLPLASDMMLDVDAGLAVVRTRLDSFRAGSIGFDFDRQTSVRGDVGAKLGFGGSFAPYVEARLFREFEGETDLRLTSGTSDTVRGQYRGTWARIGAGLGGSREWPIIASAWADVGDVKGAGLKLGLAF
jgi:outer membrane autotransporter protein